MFTCLVKYEVNLENLAGFREYAQTWIQLINKYGGTHHGYFMPGESKEQFPNPSFSFSGLGRVGASNTAVALFSFQSIEEYDSYRRHVESDPLCIEMTAKFKENPSFTGYERNFLVPILGTAQEE